MRIAHICLAQFYIDGFGYQENVITRIHKETGHEVKIIASTENYINSTEKHFGIARKYTSEDGILVDRLNYISILPNFIARKIRMYRGVYDSLEQFKPEFIFVHDIQFFDLITIVKYAKKNKIKIVADCHTDYINSARNFISMFLLHKLYYKMIIQYCKKSISIFYATLPLRGEFLHKVYGVSKSKIELLPFGADDIRLAHEDKAHIRYELRSHFGVGQEDILLVTGGKIDRKKNIDALLEAFREFKSAGRGNKIHLLVFGKVDAEMESLINFSDEDRFIHYAGWVDSKDTFRYFWAADMAIFPGTHSVLWEEAIGLGTAVVLRRWYGMEHLDLGGNCLWLEDGRKDTIKVMLEQIDSAHDVEIYSRSTFAETNGPKRFSYSAIAAQALSHAS